MFSMDVGEAPKEHDQGDGMQKLYFSSLWSSGF